jgi:hypothetical protein
LQHLVLVAIADVDVVVGADGDAVRVDQSSLAPSREDVARAVEDDDGRVVALVDVDASRESTATWLMRLKLSPGGSVPQGQMTS